VRKSTDSFRPTCYRWASMVATLPPLESTMEDIVAAKRLFLLIRFKAFREAMACVLDEEEELEVVSHAGSLADMADANLDHNIDVALIDLSLSDGDAMAAIRELSRQHGDAVALALSSVSAPSIIEQALEAGAARVLATSASIEEVVDAVRSSTRG
jgi:DNA-binding NarL/FixJ family response regulator